MADELLPSDDRPTAVFAASGTQAFGVFESARIHGLRTPDDLSVIGFDDIEMAAHVGLTTIRRPLELSGERAARVLLDLLDEPAMERKHEEQELELETDRNLLEGVTRPRQGPDPVNYTQNRVFKSSELLNRDFREEGL